ncbi:MAG: DUF4105 domain-containing protein [Massilia sp.]
MRGRERARWLPLLALLSALFCALPCRAADAPWLSLLHYRAHDGGWRSEADSASFFFSPDGQHAPDHELQANLAAVQKDRLAYACVFPARYAYLRDRITPALPELARGDCPAFDAWIAQFPGSRISISFAASYMESPSSMFGHTFLKVYQASNRELLSPTVNYAARTDARDGDLAYIRKGLLGGFPGVADELPFYRRLRTYAENEGRDIWEYELTLTPAEVRQLLLHLWEVREGIFDYYFLDENCAYRTLALIDVVRPQLGLLRAHRGVTVPVDTLRTLQAAGLVGQRTLWPAFPKLVRQHELQLGPVAVAQARQLAAGALTPASLEGQDAPAQAAILQLASEYLSVQINRDQADRETRKDTMNALLRRRLALGTSGTLAQSIPAEPPESGHAGSVFAAGVYDAGARRGATLAWAGFEHQLTDRLAGYEPYADVRVLHAQVRTSGASVRLEELDWLAVQATLPGSALFARPAWGAGLRTARRPTRDGEHLITSLDYQLGRAWQMGSLALAVLPGASVQAGQGGGLTASLSAQVTRQSSLWSAQLGWDAERIVTGSELVRTSTRFTSSLMLSRNTAVELQARRTFQPRPATDIGLALRVYLRPLSLAQ